MSSFILAPVNFNFDSFLNWLEWVVISLTSALATLQKGYQRISFMLRHQPSSWAWWHPSQKWNQQRYLPPSHKSNGFWPISLIKIQRISGQLSQGIWGYPRIIQGYLWKWGTNPSVPGQVLEDVLQITGRYTPGTLGYLTVHGISFQSKIIRCLTDILGYLEEVPKMCKTYVTDTKILNTHV